ncbi:hypothetical protein [Paenibacillus harenae]|uniref:hypothetical protein n=1 Tax=Paenibacillus harenae TaxID=306543 RepID=UPI0003F65461|nr:hypothetical protein [Paenibacillus harenae]
MFVKCDHTERDGILIDRRNSKLFDHEIELGLNEISDTEILINFSNALTSLYPHLIPIHAFGYDAWDDIVIPLFYEMVYESFSFKYGITMTPNNVHAYMYTLPSYRGICHIECIPQRSTVSVFKNFEWLNIDKQYFESKLIIFKSFSDGVNFLTGGIKKEQTTSVHFDHVEVEIVSTEIGGTAKGNIYENIFIHKDDLNLVFVAEDKE